MPAPAAPSDSHMTSALWSCFMILLGENSSMPFHLAHAAFPYGTRKTSFGVTCKEYNLQRLI